MKNKTIFDFINKCKIEPYKETHQQGIISFEGNHEFTDFLPKYVYGDIGIQIASDGRVWICIDGQAFMRFKPMDKDTYKSLTNENNTD